MERKVAIGVQNFDKIREGNYFYVNKYFKKKFVLL